MSYVLRGHSRLPVKILACAAVIAAGLGSATVAPGVLASNQARSQTLMRVSNFGQMSTRVFHADGDWTLQYSTTCRGSSTNFSITSYHSSGEYGDLIENLITRHLSKTQYEHDGGDWYLVIDGDCPWNLSVTGSGRPASTKPPAGKILLSVSATGTMSTRTFSPKGDWAISYLMTCQGTTTNFSITSYKDSQYDSLLENLITSRLNKTQFLHVRGRYYLKIDSDCPWKVTVRG
jgi:hypothetical protein